VENVTGVNNKGVRVRVHRDPPCTLLEDLESIGLALVEDCQEGSVCVRGKTHGSVRLWATRVEVQLNSFTQVP